MSRILSDPRSLLGEYDSPQTSDVEALNVRKALEEAEDVIEQQLSEQRRNQVWALADYGLVKLLLGKADGASAFYRFNSVTPPDYAYASLLSTLQPLSELDLPVSAALRQAADHLKRISNSL